LSTHKQFQIEQVWAILTGMPKDTKLTIHEDRSMAITSSAHGANIDAVGFDIVFIAMRNPEIATELMKLYAKANKVQGDDPAAPDEDYALFANEFKQL
jgi:hypothetical protein